MSFLPLELLDGRRGRHRRCIAPSIPPAAAAARPLLSTAAASEAVRSEQCKPPHGYFWLTRTGGERERGRWFARPRSYGASARALKTTKSARALLGRTHVRPAPPPPSRRGGACCAAARSPPSLQSRSGRRGKRYFTLLLVDEKTVDFGRRAE